MSITGKLTNESVSDELIHLDQTFFPTPWSDKQWRDLELKTHSLYGWREKDQLSGFALLWTMKGDDTAHLLKILLLENFRGTGSSKRFWMEIQRDLKSKGFSSVYLEVEVNNVRAKSFYERVGFKLLRRVRGYYSDGGDAFTMSLTL